MNAIEDLIGAARARAAGVEVEGVQVGLYWTAVRTTRAMGLASTLFDAPCCQAEDLPGAGCLHRCEAGELAGRLRSTSLAEASVGLATVNALLATGAIHGTELNARDLLLERGRDRQVVMVGHFTFTEALRRAARRLWVLELNPGPGDTPAAEAAKVIPRADVIGLTASTLVNHTFDDLAPLFPPHALVVMLGPSTPPSPMLFDYGVSVLAGSVVVEPEYVWQAVAQASALHGRQTGLRRLTLTRERAPA
jgi:uncharacterized protein (DUF4213/DUF364 family)